MRERKRPFNLFFLSAVLAGAIYASACEDVAEPVTQPSRPTEVTLSPAESVAEPIQIGTTVQLGAEVRDQYGQVLASPDIIWESADPEIAEVSASGVVTPVAPGTVIITAIAGGVSATLQLAVADSDYIALLALYYGTRGDGWTMNEGWGESFSLESWHGVETDDAGRVVTLNLQSNNLVGEIPAEVGRLGKLTNLDLSSNNLVGTIPQEFAGLTELETLNLSNNGLQYEIPVALGELESLEVLNLRFNDLEGNIPPELAGASSLREIDLNANSLHGLIPGELGKLENLEVLSLGFNYFSGAIPPELGALAELQTLWLWQNPLSGSVPYEFGKLAKLESLLVGSTSLSGPLTVSLAQTQLEVLGYENTDICIPRHRPFRQWIDSIPIIAGSGMDCERNDAPEAVGKLPDSFIGIGQTVSSDARTSFTDADGDTLIWGAMSSDTNTVSVAVSDDGIVTSVGVALGTATITLTARDPTGLMAEQTFVATVLEAGSPLPVDAVPDQVVEIGRDVALDVSVHFTDPDGDTLTYDVASSDTSIAMAAVSGDTVTVTTVGLGTAMVTVTASDSDSLMAEQVFFVDVVARGTPQAVGNIPDWEARTGEQNDVTASDYFTDPNDDDLTYGAMSSDDGVVAVTVSGDTVTVTAVSLGTATVTVTARDTDDLMAEQSFSVRVREAPPQITDTIPDQKIEVGSETTVDASAYFTDPEGDELAFEATSADEAVATIAVSGNVVTISAVTVGTVTLTVNATDVTGRTAKQDFGATVLAKGHPIAVGVIPDLTVRTGGEATVNVSAYFTDSDGDTLTYEVMSSDTGVAKVAVSGDTVMISAQAVGTATVTVTASDPGGLTAEQSFDIEVEGAPPVAEGTVPDQKVEVEGEGTLDVSAYFSDPDEDSLTYEAESSDKYVVTAVMSGSVLTIGGVARGTATITVTANDPGGLTAEQVFDATVVVKGHPLPVGNIPDQTVETGEEATVVVSAYFADSDGDTLTYEAMSSDTAVATVAVSGDTVTISSIVAGTATVTVTATDPDSLMAEQTFEVTVAGTPEAGDPIPSQSLSIGGEATVYASAHFTDPDGDTLTYEAMSSDTAVATVTVSGDTVTITGVAAGAATVTVTATDPDSLMAEQSFSVRVGSDGPEVTDSIPGWTIEAGQQGALDVSAYFSGNTLTYAAESSDTSVVTVTVSDSVVTYSGVADGAASIAVTAIDADSLMVDQSFAVTVVTYEPIAGFTIRSTGGVSLWHVSIGATGNCLTTPRTVNGVRHDFHWTEWQVREAGTVAWTNVPGTRREADVCGYNLANAPAGEYRIVGEVSLDGVRSTHSTTNTVTVSN